MNKKSKKFNPVSHHVISDKLISRILIVGGLMGLLSSFMLTLDKIHVAIDASFSPNCNISPILSCVSVMQSPQSEILGFPNQIIGLMAFSVIVSVGVLMHFTSGFNSRLWVLLVLGTSLGFLIINWLIIQSVFVLGALCLWCMFTWAGFAPVAWYSFVYALDREHIVFPGRLKSWKSFILKNHFSILLVWYVFVISIIILKFWYYWSTLL